MPQFDYGIIDPSTKSGSQLAADLSSQRLAVNSHHLGASEPVYKIAGMVWIDIAAAPIWKMKVYDGAAWINLFDIDILADAGSAYINGLVATLGSAASYNTGTGSSQIPLNSMLGQLAYQNTINTSNIANAAIVQALIASGAVGTTQLANLAVTAAKIANASIDTSKLLAGPAGSSLITDQSGVVTWGELANGATLKFQRFVTNGTFVPPEGVTSFKVTVTGGGGGGGSMSGSGGYGGTTSFGAYCSGTGGQPGSPGGQNYGGGGGGTGGDILITGDIGGLTLYGGPRVYGGGSYWGLGNGIGYGCGGRGAWYQGSGETPAGQNEGGNITFRGVTCSVNAGGAGGGGGGTAIKYITGLTSSVAVTIGAGGARGANGSPYGGEPGIQGVCNVEWIEV